MYPPHQKCLAKQPSTGTGHASPLCCIGCHQAALRHQNEAQALTLCNVQVLTPASRFPVFQAVCAVTQLLGNTAQGLGSGQRPACVEPCVSEVFVPTL